MEPYLRFRWRRSQRRFKKAAKSAWSHSRAFTRRHFWRRLKALRQVRRFVLGWLAVFVLAFGGLWAQSRALDGYFLTDAPVAGGTYSEGVVGTINMINPIFPENDAARSAVRLVFNGLLAYDSQGELVGELASDWEVSEDGLAYTVSLRDDVRWHDGEPFTAADVHYTLRMIRNPDTRSPLRESWADISVAVTDEHTLEFELPNPYAPFPHALTIGILPEHLLSFHDPGQLRLASFNQNPIGTGPFIFKNTLGAQGGIELGANPDYFRGAPQVDRFLLRTFPTHDELLAAYRQREIVAAGGLRATEADTIGDFSDTKIAAVAGSSQAFVFFQTEREHLDDRRVRQALTHATSRHRIALELGGNYRTATAPLLPGHLGYRSRLQQLAYDADRATRLLDDAGWRLSEGEEIRQKDGEELELTLLTQDTGVLPLVARTLQSEWAEFGVGLNVQVVPGNELEQNYIPRRDYDLILLNVRLGADADVHAFWHSSQRDAPGLNLSRYRSAIVDEALDSGRTRLDTELRAAKYEAFLEAWRRDAPAVALYRPLYYYIMRTRVYGFDVERLISSEDRYWNVAEWTVRTEPALKLFNP